MFAKKSNKILFLLVIAAILCSLFLGTINFSSAYALDNGQATDFFKIDVLNGTTSLSTDNTINYFYNRDNSAKAYIYDVKDTSDFKFIFNFTDETLGGTTPGIIDGKYTLTVEMEYLKGYSSAYFTDENGQLIDAVSKSNILTKTYTAKEGYQKFNNTSHTIAIVENDKINWGIYRFKMTLNNIEAYSDFFIIQPTMTVSQAPTIKLAQQTLDKYTVEIEIDDEYRYIDENQIKWYVCGKTTSGKNIALLQADLDTAKFIALGCTEYLYQTFDRTGYSFTLEKPQLEDGEWTVWCTYTPYGRTDSVISEDHIVEFGNQGSFMTIVWIAISLGILGIILSGVFIYVKIKHEKIY